MNFKFNRKPLKEKFRNVPMTVVEATVEQVLERYGFDDYFYPHTVYKDGDRVIVSFNDGIEWADFRRIEKILKNKTGYNGEVEVFADKTHKDSTDERELIATIEVWFVPVDNESLKEGYDIIKKYEYDGQTYGLMKDGFKGSYFGALIDNKGNIKGNTVPFDSLKAGEEYFSVATEVTNESLKEDANITKVLPSREYRQKLLSELEKRLGYAPNDSVFSTIREWDKYHKEYGWTPRQYAEWAEPEEELREYVRELIYAYEDILGHWNDIMGESLKEGFDYFETDEAIYHISNGKHLMHLKAWDDKPGFKYHDAEISLRDYTKAYRKYSNPHIYESLKEDTNEKMVIYTQMGEYCVTPKSNYGGRMQNSRKVHHMKDFESAREVMDYWNKYFHTTDDDFIIINESLKEDISDYEIDKVYKKLSKLNKVDFGALEDEYLKTRPSLKDAVYKFYGTILNTKSYCKDFVQWAKEEKGIDLKGLPCKESYRRR